MKPNEFPYDKFNMIKESKEKNLLKLAQSNGVLVIQSPVNALHWGADCRYIDRSLEVQLDFLAEYIDLNSDVVFSYLSPWHGVGIYAAAYGCPYRWKDDEAPDVMYKIHHIDDIATLKKPDIYSCEEMIWVLNAIKYFQEKTGGMMDIALTDTQSPSDTASLILDASEFLAASIGEPERLEGFLSSITDLIISFSEAQIEAAGENIVFPGHMMPSSKDLKGISISDDNMSFISPLAYENISLPYHNRIARHFGGLALHSCGQISHNAELLLKTEGLYMFDTAIGKKADTNPNKPEALKEKFMNTGVILKVRLGMDELDLLDGIVDKDIKLIVQLLGEGSLSERNRAYDKAKEKVSRLLACAH